MGAGEGWSLQKAVTLPVVWTAVAAADLIEAQAWYEQMRAGLGQRFVHAVEAAIASITENPRRFPVVHRQLRRSGVPRFPYGIFFELSDDRIVVIACFHGRRNPRLWQARERQ